MTMFVKPNRGRLVPMPNYHGLPETALPPNGATVPEDSYWFRRLREGEVFYKETHRAPFVKGTFIVERAFPLQKLVSATQMTLTAELANGQVYVLSGAWLSGEANHHTEEGTVDLEFHGQEGFYQ